MMRISPYGQQMFLVGHPEDPKNPFVKKGGKCAMRADAVRIAPTFQPDAVKRSEGSMNGYDVMYYWKGELVATEHLNCQVDNDITLSGIELRQIVEIGVG